MPAAEAAGEIEIEMGSMQIEAFDSLMEGRALTSEEWDSLTSVMETLGVKRVSTKFKSAGPYKTSDKEYEVIAELLTKGSTSEDNWAAIQPLMGAVGIKRVNEHNHKEHNMTAAVEKTDIKADIKADIKVTKQQFAILERIMDGKPIGEVEHETIRPVAKALGFRRAPAGVWGFMLSITGIQDTIDMLTVSGFNNKLNAGTSAAAKMGIVGYFSYRAGKWVWNWVTT